MTERDEEIRRRIARLVESVNSDRERSQGLFEYVWTMMCVEQGLLRIVRREEGKECTRLVLQEVQSGRLRVVTRPEQLDDDIEELAVQALARIMRVVKAAS